MSHSQRSLILGCGYLGKRILPLAKKAGFQVDVVSRNAGALSEARQLGATTCIESSLENPTWCSQLKPKDYKTIFITVGSASSSPEGYRISYIEGISQALKWIGDSPTKLIYTSSISVYPCAGGEWVEESNSPTPTGWRGKCILESESLIQRALPTNSIIARLGGLYGPDRNKFIQSSAAASSEQNPEEQPFLNLIHADDAADALHRLSIHKDWEAGIYNLTDNNPFKRFQLKEYFDQNPPARILETKATTKIQSRTRANRRISSIKIQQTLDWTPKYPTVFDALADMVW